MLEKCIREAVKSSHADVMFLHHFSSECLKHKHEIFRRRGSETGRRVLTFLPAHTQTRLPTVTYMVSADVI